MKRLTSSPMVNSIGIVKYAQQADKSGDGLLARELLGCYDGINSADIENILLGHVEFDLESESVILTKES